MFVTTVTLVIAQDSVLQIHTTMLSVDLLSTLVSLVLSMTRQTLETTHTGIVWAQMETLFLVTHTITITTTEIMVNVVLSEILVLLVTQLVSTTLEAIATGIVQGQMV